MAPPSVTFLDPHRRADPGGWPSQTSALNMTRSESLEEFASALEASRAGAVGIVVHCRGEVLEWAVSLVKSRSLVTPCYAFHEGLHAEHEFEALETGADAAFDLSALGNFLADLAEDGTRREERRADASSSLEDGHFYMKLGAGDLPSVVQFLGAGGRTGELRLEFAENGTVGQLFTAANTILHAAYESRTGLDAIVGMLVAGPAEAHFFDGRSTELRSVGERIDQALLNTAVMADETNSNT
jgi:hypothetical protein